MKKNYTITLTATQRTRMYDMFRSAEENANNRIKYAQEKAEQEPELGMWPTAAGMEEWMLDEFKALYKEIAEQCAVQDEDDSLEDAEEFED